MWPQRIIGIILVWQSSGFFVKTVQNYLLYAQQGWEKPLFKSIFMGSLGTLILAGGIYLIYASFKTRPAIAPEEKPEEITV